MDCIDSVTPKIEWIVASKSLKIKIITHLGAGGKTDPSKVQIARLINSHNCQLGTHVKKRLKKVNVGFEKIKCVFSSELQQKQSLQSVSPTDMRATFLIAIARDIIAGVPRSVLRDWIKFPLSCTATLVRDATPPHK